MRARGFVRGGEVDGEEGESEEEEEGKRETRRRFAGGAELEWVSAETGREDEGVDSGRDEEGVDRWGDDNRRERDKDGVGGELAGRLRHERQNLEKADGPERRAGERRQEWQRVIVIELTKGECLLSRRLNDGVGWSAVKVKRRGGLGRWDGRRDTRGGGDVVSSETRLTGTRDLRCCFGLGVCAASVVQTGVVWILR